MTPEMFVELFRDALWMVLIMVCAIIIQVCLSVLSLPFSKRQPLSTNKR